MYERQINAIMRHLVVKEGQVFATSLDVANFFIKKHKHVLDAIKNLEAPEEFTGPNFRPSEYKDSTGRTLPMVEMTRKGFVLLAMGFTGPEAMKFKIAYIEAFDKMEAVLFGGRSYSLPAGEGVGELPGQLTVVASDRYVELLESENKFLKGEKLRKHRSPQPLTEENRAEILRMFADGISQAEIARQVSRSGATISYVVRMSVREKGVAQ